MMADKIRLPSGRFLVMDGRFHIMGILNITPDSFWEGSRLKDTASVIDRAAMMIEEGADILDMGGESSRPKSEYLSTEAELERVIPAIEAVRARWDIPISLDTRKLEVAREGFARGADIINDISALDDDPGMAAFCAENGIPVVLMHKKGIPLNMQDSPYYDDCPKEVFSFLLDHAARAEAAGIPGGQIILDPGIGFGKRLEDNISLLSRLDDLTASGYPVMAALSRKSFLGMITGRDTGGRLAGSIAGACLARQKGASIFRVHDVAETVDALKVFDSVKLDKQERQMH